MTVNTDVRQSYTPLVGGVSRWEPRQIRDARSTRLAALLCIALCILGLASLWSGAAEPFSRAIAVFSLACGTFGAGGCIVSTAQQGLFYELGPDTLTAVWCGRRLIAPYSDVEGVTGGRSGRIRTSRIWRPFGVLVGDETIQAVGSRSKWIYCLATTTDPAAQTTVQVGDSTLVLSPSRFREFRATLIQHLRSLGDEPADGNNPRWTIPITAPWTAWHDRAWLVVAAGSWCLAVSAVISTALRTGISGSSQLAATAITLLLVNMPLAVWLHARNQLLGRVLAGATCGIQAILLVGVWRLTA